MNSKIKKAGLYIAGMSIGAGFGVFIATFIIDVIQTQQYYRENEMPVEETEGDEQEVKPSRFKVKERQIIDYNTIAGKKVSTELIAKYGLKSDVLQTEEETEVIQYTDPVEETVVNIDRSQPYPISLETFEDDKIYPKSQLIFYSGDEVLVDKKGNVILNYETFLGKDLINMFGQLSEDKDLVYIRNEKLRADYHIIMVDESFNGEDEDEDPRMKRAKRVAD